MYRILYDGEVVGIVESPRYVAKNDNGIYVRVDSGDTIAVGGVAYEGAVAREVDGGEWAVETETLRAEVDFLNLLTGVEELEDEEVSTDDAGDD